MSLHYTVSDNAYVRLGLGTRLHYGGMNQTARRAGPTTAFGRVVGHQAYTKICSEQLCNIWESLREKGPSVYYKKV